MKKVVFVAVILSVVASVYAGDSIVGSGNAVTESRALTAFHAVEFHIPGNLTVTIGEQKPVSINTDDNIAPLIKTEIKDGTLTVRADQPFTTKNGPDVQITIPDLTALVVHGSADAQVKGLDNEALAVSAHGSTDVHLYGKTKSLVLTLHGSAEVHAFELGAQQAVVTINGSADAKIAVDESLVATIHGTGGLTYTGSPRVISTVHGGGAVQKHKS